LTKPIDSAKNKSLLISQRNLSPILNDSEKVLLNVDSDINNSNGSILQKSEFDNTGINVMASKYSPDITNEYVLPQINQTVADKFNNG